MASKTLVRGLGQSVLAPTVGRWLKNEGEPRSVGEPPVELETEPVAPPATPTSRAASPGAGPPPPRRGRAGEGGGGWDEVPHEDQGGRGTAGDAQCRAHGRDAEPPAPPVPPSNASRAARGAGPKVS